MAAQNWNNAFDAVIVHEGGYVDHPNDPGGATNLGITIGTLSDWLGRPASKAEVKSLTRAKVKPIYKKNYWDVVRGDDLPRGVDYAVFDFSVNSGPRRSAEFLQRIVGTTVDGRIGPNTLAAVNSMRPDQVITRLCDNRLAWLKGLSTWSTFGRGWERRVNEVKSKALSWVKASPQPIPSPAPQPVPEKPAGNVNWAGLVVLVIIIAVAAFFVINLNQ